MSVSKVELSLLYRLYRTHLQPETNHEPSINLTKISTFLESVLARRGFQLTNSNLYDLVTIAMEEDESNRTVKPPTESKSKGSFLGMEETG